MIDDKLIEDTTALLQAARKVAKSEFQPVFYEDANSVVNLARLMHEIAIATPNTKGPI